MRILCILLCFLSILSTFSQDISEKKKTEKKNEDVLQIPSVEEKTASPNQTQSDGSSDCSKTDHYSGELFTILEEPPSLKNGTFLDHIATHLRYPTEAFNQKIQGRVYVEFIVEKDGNVSSARILRGIGGGCDEEVLRIICLTSGLWSPGKQRGEIQRVKLVQPITFKL